MAALLGGDGQESSFQENGTFREVPITKAQNIDGVICGRTIHKNHPYMKW
jgi:hypothetical protein